MAEARLGPKNRTVAAAPGRPGASAGAYKGASEVHTMDIPSQIIRDRRIAASDETVSVAGSAIYGRGSHAREHGAVGRRGDRGGHEISTIILHQTAGAMISGGAIASADDAVSSHHRADRIAAHFIVTVDGQALYLHDVEFIMNNAGGRRGIDIEVCGRYGHGPTPSGQRLPIPAILACRQLVQALTQAIPSIRHIHPHGQVQQTAGGQDTDRGPKFDSCCGPDIWVNVGLWAQTTLGLVSDRTDGYPNHGISPRQTNEAYRQLGAAPVEALDAAPPPELNALYNG